MSRLLLFVHYHRYGGLAKHVLYTLTQVKPLFARVVFISNSPLTETQREKLAGLTETVIQRENRGFDFGAWRDALNAERDTLAQYDSVTLMNDTCFGPLFDLGALYAEYDADDKVDFWGMTGMAGDDCGMPGALEQPIPAHLQSYFLCFKRGVIESPAWQNFWCRVADETKAGKVIYKYEKQLTKILTDAGFHAAARFTSKHDSTLREADLIVAAGVPFVKVKAFAHHAHPQYLLRLIREKSAYPTALIHDYLNEIYSPDETLFMQNKILPARSGVTVKDAAQKIAVHLHVFYLDVFAKYVAYFDAWNFAYDLFITTDAAEKKAAIADYLKNHPTEKHLQEIIITENRGRDVAPWLTLADRLRHYDVVGKFHTKKNPHLNPWSGASWQQDIFDMLVAPAATIINAFADDVERRIGLVLADLAYFLQFHYSPVMQPDTLKHVNFLRQRCGCYKEPKLRGGGGVIVPVGTMFWYRPAALAPLFDLRLTPADFPPEPLPNDGTLAHGVEYLLVYLAWNENYDYRIVTPEFPSVGAFHHNHSWLNRRLNRNTRKKNIYEKIYAWGEWGKICVWSITQSIDGEKTKYNFCGIPLLKIARRTSGKQYRLLGLLKIWTAKRSDVN